MLKFYGKSIRQIYLNHLGSKFPRYRYYIPHWNNCILVEISYLQWYGVFFKFWFPWKFCSEASSLTPKTSWLQTWSHCKALVRLVEGDRNSLCHWWLPPRLSLSAMEKGKNSALIFFKVLEKGWTVLIKRALVLLRLALVTKFILVSGELKKEGLRRHLVVIDIPHHAWGDSSLPTMWS